MRKIKEYNYWDDLIEKLDKSHLVNKREIVYNWVLCIAVGFLLALLLANAIVQ